MSKEENMEIYNALRSVPESAKRKIAAGRLKGFTNINTMWRIKALTEQFGPCGIGWKTVVTKEWLEQGADGAVTAHCNLNLYIRVGGEWSEAIEGCGGAAYVSLERSGKYTSDEAFKMARSDALSYACKNIGVAADVYFEEDADNKYAEQNFETPPTQNQRPVQKAPSPATVPCAMCGKPLGADFAAKSKNKYGVAVCSGECLAGWQVAHGMNNG